MEVEDIHVEEEEVVKKRPTKTGKRKLRVNSSSSEENESKPVGMFLIGDFLFLVSYFT